MLNPDVLIIGYGNPVRGDDGAGPRVVEELAADEAVRERCSLLSCHQLLPEHIEILSRHARVVFVDASRVDPPGQVVLGEIEAPPAPREACCAPHSMQPDDVLNAAGALYGASPRAYLCRIGGAEFGFSHHISSAARRAVKEAVELIKEVVLYGPEKVKK